MERPRWLLIIDPGDFRVEDYEDYLMVYQELVLAAEEESKILGARVMACFKTLA